MCPLGACDISAIDPNNWEVTAIPNIPLRVEYCLSKRTPGQCKLILSIPILAAVVGCHVLKLIGLTLTWLYLDRCPLITLGGKVLRNEAATGLTVRQMQ